MPQGSKGKVKGQGQGRRAPEEFAIERFPLFRKSIAEHLPSYDA